MRIKPEFIFRQVSFGGHGNLNLGDLNPDQVEELNLIGKKSGDTSILELFEGDKPKAEDLQKKKIAEKIAKIDGK